MDPSSDSTQRKLNVQNSGNTKPHLEQEEKSNVLKAVKVDPAQNKPYFRNVKEGNFRTVPRRPKVPRAMKANTHSAKHRSEVQHAKNANTYPVVDNLQYATFGFFPEPRDQI